MVRILLGKFSIVIPSNACKMTQILCGNQYLTREMNSVAAADQGTLKNHVDQNLECQRILGRTAGELSGKPSLFKQPKNAHNCTEIIIMGDVLPN